MKISDAIIRIPQTKVDEKRKLNEIHNKKSDVRAT